MPGLDYPGKVILGIDTSLGTAVAVVEPDGVVRSQVESADPRGHAEAIGSLIEQALAEASVDPADITHVAAGMGPGPSPDCGSGSPPPARSRSAAASRSSRS